MGANHSNTDIRIDRNRIFGNGTCPGGIVIAQGNARTVLANNLIYGNGQNGVTFGAGQGGPHYVVGNTIHGNGHNGVSYDNANRITSITDPIGRTVTYTYNAQGTLETVTDLEGGVTRYEYDSDNNVTRIIDPRGVVRAENTYFVGKVISQKQADGGVLNFIYQLGGPCVASSERKGTGPFPQNCNPIGPVQETTFIDPLGRFTTYRFDPQGFLLNVTDPLGQTRSFEREPGTNLLLATKGTGSGATCGNSSAGDESFTYDNSGNVLTHTDALGNTTSFFGLTDTINSTVATVDQDGKSSGQFLYEPFGQTTTNSDYPFQFTGRVPVTESLYHYRARYYEPVVGRFIGRDPNEF